MLLPRAAERPPALERVGATATDNNQIGKPDRSGKSAAQSVPGGMF